MNRQAQAPAVRTPRGRTSALLDWWLTTTTGGVVSSSRSGPTVNGGGTLRLAAAASVARARSRTVVVQLIDFPFGCWSDARGSLVSCLINQFRVDPCGVSDG